MQLAMKRGHPSGRDAQQGGSGGAWSPGPGQNHYSTQYKLGKAKGLKQLSGVRLEVMAVGGLAAESLAPQSPGWWTGR